MLHEKTNKQLSCDDDCDSVTRQAMSTDVALTVNGLRTACERVWITFKVILIRK